MAFKTCKCLCKVQSYVSAKPLDFTPFKLLFPFFGDLNKLVGTQTLPPGSTNVFKITPRALSDPEASLTSLIAVYTKKCKTLSKP